MSWVTMADLTTGDIVTEADMDAMRQNVDFLREKPVAVSLQESGTDYATSSTAFVDIDATNLVLSVTVPDCVLMAVFEAAMIGNSNVAYVDLLVNAARRGGTYGLRSFSGASTEYHSVTVTHIWSVAAGTYIIKPQWRVSSNSATIKRNAHPVFLGVTML